MERILSTVENDQLHSADASQTTALASQTFQEGPSFTQHLLLPIQKVTSSTACHGKNKTLSGNLGGKQKQYKVQLKSLLLLVHLFYCIYCYS